MPKPAPPEKKKRGRPQKGEIREVVKLGKLERQQGKPLAQLLLEPSVSAGVSERIMGGPFSVVCAGHGN